MTSTSSNRKTLLKKVGIPAAFTILLIAVAITLQLLYGERLKQLVQNPNYVYLGAFAISVVGNATVVLPVAVLAILAPIGILLFPTTGWLGPLFVGIAGGAGAALGEMSGYMVGFSGRSVVEKSKLYNKLHGWMTRWGFLAVFLFSAFPFFFDLVGIIAGVLRLPVWKFLVFCWLGRTLMYSGVIVAVALGYKNILPIFTSS
jgi:membrane protein YqaA with SNARE-associated domain